MATNTDPQMVYDFPLGLEIGVAAVVLIALLGITHHRVLGYWAWCLRSRSPVEWIVTILLVLGQALMIAALAAIVPVTHELFGVRPTSELAGWFLVAEAILAGWAAFTLVPGPEHATEGEATPTKVLIRVLGAAGLALDEHSQVCVRPVLERVIDKSDGDRSSLLKSLRDWVKPAERAAVDIMITNVLGAWGTPGEGRERASNALTDYINDERIPASRLLRRR